MINKEIVLIIDIGKPQLHMIASFYDFNQLKYDLSEDIYEIIPICDSIKYLNFFDYGKFDKKVNYIIHCNKLEFEKLLELVKQKQVKVDSTTKDLQLKDVLKEELASLNNAKTRFIKWFRAKGEELYTEELLHQYSQKFKSTKTQQYLDFVRQFIREIDTNPDYVQKVLTDKERWGDNPYHFFSLALKEIGTARKILKTHPCFVWIGT